MAHLQSVSAQGSNVTSIASPAITSSSDSLLVLSGTRYGGGSMTPSDSKSNTWSVGRVMDGAIDGQQSAGQWYNLAGTRGASHTGTITLPIASFPTVALSEFDDVLTTPLDVTAQSEVTGTNAHASGTTGTTAQADELVVITMAHNGGSSNGITPSAGFTEATEQTNTANEPINVAYKIVGETGAQSGSWDLSPNDSVTHIAVICTYKMAPSGIDNPVVSGTSAPADPPMSWDFSSPFDFTRMFARGASSTGTLFTQTLAGGASFVGGMTIRGNKTVAGALGFSGALTKTANKVLASSLGFVGAVSKRVSRTLSGTLSFVGTLTASHMFGQALTGALSFSGALTKRTARSLSGGLSFTGAVAKATYRSLTGALSFAGTVTRSTSRAFAGGVSFSGAAIKKAIKTLSGGVSFSGAVTMIKSFTMALSGVISFSGGLARSAGKALGGAVGLAGALNRSTGHPMSGAVNFSGALVRRAGKSMAGAVGFAGDLARKTVNALAGGLSFAGSVATQKFTGGFTQVFTAAVSFSGSVSKRMSRSFSGVASFSGGLVKQTSRSLLGAVSFVGVSGRSVYRALAGSVSFAATLTKRVGKSIAGTVSFVGGFEVHRVVEWLQARIANLGMPASMRHVAAVVVSIVHRPSGDDQ